MKVIRVSVYMQNLINTLAFDFYLIVYELYKLFLEFKFSNLNFNSKMTIKWLKIHYYILVLYTICLCF